MYNVCPTKTLELQSAFFGSSSIDSKGLQILSLCVYVRHPLSQMSHGISSRILVPPRELQILCAKATNTESENAVVLTVGFVKMGPPTWLKDLEETHMWKQDGQDFITPEGVTEALRALPLKTDLRASHSLDIDYFWSWAPYGIWSLPWRKPHGPDPGVFDATGPLRLIWILLLGRLKLTETNQDPVMWANHLHNTLKLTPEHMQDILELGGTQWRQDVTENMSWVSNRLLMTREGLELILRITPSVIRGLLRLGDPSFQGLWQCQSGGLDRDDSWVLARAGYKTDPICFCYQVGRQTSPRLRLRVALSMRRRLGCQRQMAPGQARDVQAVIIPWVRTPSSMAKWACCVMTEDTKGDMSPPAGLQIDSVTGMSYGYDLVPVDSSLVASSAKPAESTHSVGIVDHDDWPGQKEQVTLPHKDTMNGSKTLPTTQDHKEGLVNNLVDLEIKELNRQAQQERQRRREALTASPVAVHMVAPIEEPPHLAGMPVTQAATTSLEIKEVSKKQRAKQHRREQRHILAMKRVAEKQTKQDHAFFQMCRPAFEVAKRGSEDQTQVQEDPLPEIERRTQRALGAQMRQQRRDEKLAKKIATRLESAEMKRLVLGTVTPKGWDV